MDRLTDILATLPETATPETTTTPKAKRVRKPRAKKTAAPTTAPVVEPTYKRHLTIALGVAIPVLSLAASRVAGTLALHGHWSLAAFGAVVGVAVLAVSLSHLAWSVRDITGSGHKASWALAVALDCSLVLCELVHVTAADAGLGVVCWVLMVGVAAFSMVLNCHAFLNHKS